MRYLRTLEGKGLSTDGTIALPNSVRLEKIDAPLSGKIPIMPPRPNSGLDLIYFREKYV